jgi:glutamate N-acetyltransferase/amino-acid N-acetyltransferase
MSATKGVTYPLGFRAAGAACGLKKNGNPDVALVASDRPAAAAGIFTRNVVKGHSLQLCRSNVADGRAQAVVLNSGCANACVGERGMQDAQTMAALTAQAVGCPQQDVLTGSTGVIGMPLDMAKLSAGIAAAALALSPEGGDAAAHAIMTTDTVDKQAGAELTIGGHPVRIGGMAKGSGMIHPNMATMIAVVTTDCAIAPDALRSSLTAAAAVSFNRISVDGDTSVCDTALVLANGASGCPTVQAGTTEHAAFTAALSEVCHALSRMLAADGEGATKLLEIRVEGLPTPEAALQVAQAIAKSPLVKTAAFGCDANWGRLLTAAGYAGVDFNPDLVDVYIGPIIVCAKGQALSFDEEAALEILRQKEVPLRLEFHQGPCSDFMLTCDLSFDYVKINGSYRT